MQMSASSRRFGIGPENHQSVIKTPALRESTTAGAADRWGVQVPLAAQRSSHDLWSVAAFAGLLICAATFTSGAAANELTREVDGLTTKAWLESAGDDAPLVFMLHGTLGHARMETLAGIQTALAERGLSSLSINLSYGIDGRSGIFECDAPVTHGLAQHFVEIDAWRDWARDEGFDIVGWFGHSRGGNQIARWAFERGEAAPLLLLAPSTSDFEAAGEAYDARSERSRDDWLEKANTMIAAGEGAALMGEGAFLYCDALPFSAQAFVTYYGDDPHADTPTLLADSGSEQPVIVWIGSTDEVVADLPERLAAKKADGAAQNLTSITIDGADHFFRDFFAEDVADSAVDFLVR